MQYPGPAWLPIDIQTYNQENSRTLSHTPTIRRCIMFCRCSISIHHWLLILTSVLILSGCGQKGALYLPDDTSAEAVLQTSLNG